MIDLLKTAIEAHGGLERWNQLNSVSARLTQGGALWALKGQAGVLDDVVVTREPARRASVAPAIRRCRPTQFVHPRTRRDRGRRRNCPRGTRPAARLVCRTHARDPVEHPPARVLRGHGDVDIPDAAVHVHDARISRRVSWTRGMKPGSAGGGYASPGRATSPPTAPNRRCTSTATAFWRATTTTSRSAAARARRTTSPTTTTSRASGSRPGTGSSRATPTASRSPNPSSSRSISARSRSHDTRQPSRRAERSGDGNGSHLPPFIRWQWFGRHRGRAMR